MLRKQVNAIEARRMRAEIAARSARPAALPRDVLLAQDSLNTHIARSEARHAELVALLGGASAIKPQTLPGPPATEPPNGPRPAALDRLDSVSC